MKPERLILWTALVGLDLLTTMSIIAAFIGSESADIFFGSAPLMVYWCFGVIIFAAAFFSFPRLVRQPALAAVHLGCMLVLIGGLWGTETGHKIAAKITGKQKIDEGYMVIFEGQSDNRVFGRDLDKPTTLLPFSIGLNDFRIEYYQPGTEQTSHIPGTVKDYYSDLGIFENGKEILTTTVEVNHPLHYKGYHLYQDSYATDNDQSVIIIAVTSDSGLHIVFTGYWLICIGVIWQMWLRHILAYFKTSKEEPADDN